MNLASVASLARRVGTGSWFAAVGEPLTAGERTEALLYLAGLGLAGPTIDPVADWSRAKALADAPDWDPAWWEAEERLRVALLESATSRHGRPALLEALSRVTQAASDSAHGQASIAAARAGVADPALARAASGALTQACYLAALGLAAGVGPDHPFLAKLRLFEAGRWPLGIVAGRFHVF